MGIIDYNQYWFAYSCWTGINTIYALIFVGLFAYTLHVGSRNYGQGVLQWMSSLSMIYIVTYFVGYLLQFCFAIGGYVHSDGNKKTVDSTSLPSGFIICYYLGQFTFDSFGLLFITLQTFRLRQTFNDTQYKINNKLFIFIHVITIICAIMIILYEVIDLTEDIDKLYSKDSIIFLFIYIVLDLIIEIILILSFISKFIKVFKLNVKVYGANRNLEKDTQSNWMSRITMEAVIRQSFLAIISMICECLYLFGKLGRYALIYEGDSGQEYSIFGWYIAIIPTWIKIFCIYLSFGYTSNSYDRFCSLCHNSLKSFCTNYYMNKLKRQESNIYHELQD